MINPVEDQGSRFRSSRSVTRGSRLLGNCEVVSMGWTQTEDAGVQFLLWSQVSSATLPFCLLWSTWESSLLEQVRNEMDPCKDCWKENSGIYQSSPSRQQLQYGDEITNWLHHEVLFAILHSPFLLAVLVPHNRWAQCSNTWQEARFVRKSMFCVSE